jgi:ornithine carbamoyltransferase
MAIYLSSSDLQLSRGESVSDTARVLSRYVNMVMIRAFSQDMVEEFAKNADVPVINGLTDLAHPCQVMSDVYTILEMKGERGKSLDGLKVVYLGDGNNLANSWINAAVLFGFDLTLACPEELMPDDAILKAGLEKSKGKIEVVHDPKAAVSDADVIYTDTWLSMGDDEEKRGWKLDILGGYKLNGKILSLAPKDTMVMHCLPAHRGKEITDEVMDGKNSVVFPQAENRLHVQKAIMDILNERQESK